LCKTISDQKKNSINYFDIYVVSGKLYGLEVPIRYRKIRVQLLRVLFPVHHDNILTPAITRLYPSMTITSMSLSNRIIEGRETRSREGGWYYYTNTCCFMFIQNKTFLHIRF